MNYKSDVTELWCKSCNLETNNSICPICEKATVADIPSEVYWCEQCNTPIIQLLNQADKGICPICRSSTKYLASDLRPVFPEERLLLELLLKKNHNEYINSSVWATKNRYFIDGKTITLSAKIFAEADIECVISQLEKYKVQNNYKSFNSHIQTFIEANHNRLDELKTEAFSFIRSATACYDDECIVVSFSGGKDSTVTADLAVKALSNPYLVHIFGDTTLEFPSTIEYATRFRKAHPQTIFQIARNNDQEFYDVCEDIGPPARMMRWCCSMFKTGPITRIINSLYENKQILTLYGIRKVESVSRSKYNRIEQNPEHVKIQQQTVASPIFFWKDIDIWLYIHSENIDFNDAYRLGYDRVGCWCCPNNNQRAQFLSRIYMPKQSEKWHNFLIRFAKKIGKPDPEIYIDSGKWKARQGGNGLQSAHDVKIKYTNCTTEDHAKIYSLVRSFDDELIGMFIPFGRIAPELGRKILNEVIVLDSRTNIPILSIQPYGQEGYEYGVKVKTVNVADHDNLQRMVSYQIKKFNACRKCLKCESICRVGAISISSSGYFIDSSKCVHCKDCVTAKYLDGGCMMDKYLRTK